MAMSGRLTGALYTFASHALYVGPLIAASRHRHHAGQVVWAPGGVEVEREHRPPRRGVLFCLRPHEEHSHGAAAEAAVLWVDRDDLPWDAAPPEDSGSLSAALDLGATVDAGRARALGDALLGVIAPMHDARMREPRHPAVRRMCSLLDSQTAEGKVRVDELARQSGLSARQLRHRFTAELGINPSAYRRWRRLRHAIAALGRGATLTESAFEAGFADGAHFSRVFQAQFGMAPSQAFASVRLVDSVAGSSSLARR
jgi:AraC-like DNA-binding protein